MHNRIRKAAVALAAAAGISVLASTPASASSTPQATTITHSSNWAGYYSLSDNAIDNAYVYYTVPKVNCAHSRGYATPGIGYAGSMWLGFGGMHLSTGSAGNNWLEQAGVQVFCSSLHAQPVYEPFYEIVPTKQDPDSYYHEPVVFDKGRARVHAGDDIEVAIDTPATSLRPGYWNFVVLSGTGSGLGYDANQLWSAYVKLPKGTYTGNPSSTAHDTVEVITECPTSDHHLTGFVDLGTVNYLYADYQTASPAFPVVSIASHPLTLEHPNPGPAAVYPGAPYTGTSPPQGSIDADDSFRTFYAKNWGGGNRPGPQRRAAVVSTRISATANRTPFRIIFTCRVIQNSL